MHVSRYLLVRLLSTGLLVRQLLQLVRLLSTGLLVRQLLQLDTVEGSAVGRSQQLDEWGGGVQAGARSLSPLFAALAISPKEITEFAPGTPQARSAFPSSLLPEVFRCRRSMDRGRWSIGQSIITRAARPDQYCCPKCKMITCNYYCYYYCYWSLGRYSSLADSDHGV
jgi:hypothetical protein